MPDLRNYLEEFVAGCISDQEYVPYEVLTLLSKQWQQLIDIGDNTAHVEHNETCLEEFLSNFENFVITKKKSNDGIALYSVKQRLQESVDIWILRSNSYETIRAERLSASLSVLALLQELNHAQSVLQGALQFSAEVEEYAVDIFDAKVNQLSAKFSTKHLQSHYRLSKALPELEGILVEEKCRLEESVGEKKLLLKQYEEVNDSAEYCKLLLDYKKLIARKMAIM